MPVGKFKTIGGRNSVPDDSTDEWASDFSSLNAPASRSPSKLSSLHKRQKSLFNTDASYLEEEPDSSNNGKILSSSYKSAYPESKKTISPKNNPILSHRRSNPNPGKSLKSGPTMSFLEYSRKQKTAAKKKQKERKEQEEEPPKAEQMDKSLETRSLRKRSSSVCYLENTTMEEENPDESNKEIEEMEDVKNKTPKKKPRMEVEGSKSGKKSSGIPSSGIPKLILASGSSGIPDRDDQETPKTHRHTSPTQGSSIRRSKKDLGQSRPGAKSFPDSGSVTEPRSIATSGIPRLLLAGKQGTPASGQENSGANPAETPSEMDMAGDRPARDELRSPEGHSCGHCQATGEAVEIAVKRATLHLAEMMISILERKEKSH